MASSREEEGIVVGAVEAENLSPKSIIQTPTMTPTTPTTPPSSAPALVLSNSGKRKLVEIVNELLSLPDINANALTRDHKTALDIAEDLPLSEESSLIKEFLCRYGALEQTRRTNKNVHNISNEIRKNNSTNSVTVVAVLFATVAFAAIFTVPGGDDDNGKGVMVKTASFKIFFIFNAIALFTSLAVVVVQITLVGGETKAERRLIEVMNKLLWLASVCTSVAFMASSFIVVG
ncbi:hypothetical protein ACFE04_003708 [Oxalis oulophora]